MPGTEQQQQRQFEELEELVEVESDIERPRCSSRLALSKRTALVLLLTATLALTVPACHWAWRLRGGVASAAAPKPRHLRLFKTQGRRGQQTGGAPQTGQHDQQQTGDPTDRRATDNPTSGGATQTAQQLPSSLAEFYVRLDDIADGRPWTQKCPIYNTVMTQDTPPPTVPVELKNLQEYFHAQGTMQAAILDKYRLLEAQAGKQCGTLGLTNLVT